MNGALTYPDAIFVVVSERAEQFLLSLASARAAPRRSAPLRCRPAEVSIVNKSEVDVPRN